MSDLELLLKRRKREEASVKAEEGRPNKDEGSVQTPEHPVESRVLAEAPRPDRTEPREKVQEPSNHASEPRVQSEDRAKVMAIMERFGDRDPKIGVWSYPAFLLLQYLYSTVPGFRMSRVAKEALERGLKEMYPELYLIAEEVARKIYAKKGIILPESK
ncbi:MAG: hypothetical protein JHC23_04135 [Sulfolobus sp.]|nr:hypothetical protein [Sulfolobus sp.]